MVNPGAYATVDVNQILRVTALNRGVYSVGGILFASTSWMLTTTGRLESLEPYCLGDVSCFSLVEFASSDYPAIDARPYIVVTARGGTGPTAQPFTPTPTPTPIFTNTPTPTPTRTPTKTPTATTRTRPPNAYADWFLSCAATNTPYDTYSTQHTNSHAYFTATPTSAATPTFLRLFLLTFLSTKYAAT